MALQVTRDDDEVERVDRQRIHREVRAPPADAEVLVRGVQHRIADGVLLHIHTEHAKSVACQHQRVTPAAHREIERSSRRRDARRQHRDPVTDKRRR